MKSFEQLGQSAYAAYCKAVGGISATTGRQLPAFQGLGQVQQQGWIAAAKQVVAEHAAVH